jgi:hypothetical protein
MSRRSGSIPWIVVVAEVTASNTRVYTKNQFDGLFLASSPTTRWIGERIILLVNLTISLQFNWGAFDCHALL